MSNKTDFVTENGELKRYVGKDTKVIIPEGVVSLGKFCFEDSNVEQIVVPSTVQNIEAVAFLETPNLQSIVVDENNTTYCSVDGCLYSKDKPSLFAVQTETHLFTLQMAASQSKDARFSKER